MDTVYVYMICLFVLAGCAVYFMSRALYILIPYIVLKLAGERVPGQITGYQTKRYYTKERPRKMRIVYYPEIEFYQDRTVTPHNVVVETVRNPHKQEYQIGSRVELLISRWNSAQFAINGDFRKLAHIVRFVVSSYFVWLLLQIQKSVPVLYQDISGACNRSLLLVVAIFFINLIIMIKRERLTSTISAKYSLVNSILFAVFFIMTNLC